MRRGEDSRNMRVLQSRKRVDMLLETGAAGRIGDRGCGQELDGHVAPAFQIARTVQAARSSALDPLGQHELFNASRDQERPLAVQATCVNQQGCRTPSGLHERMAAVRAFARVNRRRDRGLGRRRDRLQHADVLTLVWHRRTIR